MPAQDEDRLSVSDGAPAAPDGQELDRFDSGAWFPIVGIGASAGGLDACEALLAALPPDTGMAFVIIQHLHPRHASLMGDLLASHTRMPVTQATESVLIEPNRIYLIPPGVSLSIVGDHLHLSERANSPMAFDFFLRSLAENCGNRAVCVVLSGSGTDGSEGLKAIKANGGLVVVQDPSEAAFDGMPNSAILTRQVDLVLPVAEIPGALIQNVTRARIQSSMAKPGEKEHTEIRFSEILDLVRARTRQDFSPYKTGTITRRIERRMVMAGITNIAGYVDKLRTDPAELDSLAHDLLINVTQFFRDQTMYEVLQASVIPEMVAAQPLDKPLRIWVPGCSTGEEVYSLTMLFLQAIAAAKRNIKLQVFASDVDAQSVAFARAGYYGVDIEAQMSAEQLGQFFLEEGGGYRVARALRDTIVFTAQDLLADPPFSRLDLISCRNVLIYLRPGAQDQILSLFHFALRPGGVLVLGRSESARQYNNCFEPIDRKQGIYRHVAARPAITAQYAARPAPSP
jgi:two-component system CheB/CheR fusion protein